MGGIASFGATARISAADGAETTDSRRVLILRSCRLPQFERAVRFTRERTPGATLVALTHAGHRNAVQAAGVDDVVEIPGHRFGLFRMRPSAVRRLRSQKFDEVVIPQMSRHADLHLNLYGLVLALRPRRVVILPGDMPPIALERGSFRRWVLRHAGVTALLVRADTIMFLLLLLAACVAPRRAAREWRGRKRRVLHIISSLGVGGAQVQLAELLNRTPTDQYDVELLVLGGDDGDFSRQWLTREGLSVSYVEEWPRLSPSVREIMRRCRAGRYDMVHTWLFMANMVGAAAARLAGVPLVIGSVRNLSVWKRERWYRRWWHRLGDILGSHAADVVTVNANALVDDHAKWAWMRRSAIQVVHNGLDPARFDCDRDASRQALIELTGASPSARLIGTVGRLAHEKDQATFLRILAEVRAQRDDVHGVIIGDGELRATLEQLARELRVDDGVTFLGSRSDARRLMAGLDLFVLTSRSEGFPNVLLEATFLQVPCVATNIAGNPDVLEREESLFPQSDWESGAYRVLQALSDRAATAERTAAVRARAMRMFTSEHSVATWLELYDRSLSKAA